MYQGTRYLLPLIVDNVNLDGAKTVIVDMADVAGGTIQKATPLIEVVGNQIAVTLTQEETLQIPEGPVRIQVRWVDADDAPGVSEMGYIDVHGIMTKYIIGGET